MKYDPLGNICQRDNNGTLSSYTYAQLGGCGLNGLPGAATSGGSATSGYQLLQAGTEHFVTDANGSMTLSTSAANGAGTVTRGWDYDAQNHAISVWEGASEAASTLRTRWDYGPDGARFRRTDDGSSSSGGSTTLYLDNVERVTTGSNVTWRRTVAGIAVMALAGTTAGVFNNTHTLLHDHIGSVVAVADSSGHFVERADYSAFGGMRASIGAVPVGLTALATTTRGFTGHEQLGSIDTIHMNGRIYDPKLGRFLQADPMVAEPGNPQNWNPYSYVFNNPLANTDPTGMFSIRQALGLIIGVVFAVVSQQYWLLGNFFAAFATATAGGFLSAIVSTGSLKQGLIGAFEADLTLGIGNTDWGALEKVGANALAGGVVAVLSGGRFGNGFVSAGLTAEVMPIVGNTSSTVERSIEGALIGGTISAATGGKFADGAISGAIQGAMEEPSKEPSQYEYDAPGNESCTAPTATQAAAMQRDFDNLIPSFSAVEGNTPQQTADDFSKIALPFTAKWGFEIGANIVSNQHGYGLMDVTEGQCIQNWQGVNIPNDGLSVASVHTHPLGSLPGFSGAMQYTQAGGTRLYDGDIASDYVQNEDGYVYRVGGGEWYYNNEAFLSGLHAAQQAGTTIDSRWYVKGF